ncbi:MAG: hypothetical protein U1F57_10150 [bacterium]
MKKCKTCVSLLLLLFFSACASGPGSSEGNRGVAALSFQLAPLEKGTTYQTADGFQLSFTHFSVAFSEALLKNPFLEQKLGEPVAADFPSEAAEGIAKIEEVPGVEYDRLLLSLGTAGDVSDPLPSELAGHTVFIEAKAQNGGEECLLRVFLDAPGQTAEVDFGGGKLAIRRDQDNPVPILIDAAKIFEAVNLAGSCTGGNTVAMTENGANGPIFDRFLHSFLLGEIPEPEAAGE